MGTWQGVDHVLLEQAELDLVVDDHVRPCLVALRGDDLLFVAFMRPFPPHGYHQPLLELFALASPLDADRLALSLSGRAWSLDDPIPPVVDGVGDLRERVMVIHRVDGHVSPLRNETVLRPFTVEGGRVQWGEALEPGPGEGWICGAMEAVVKRRHEVNGSLEGIRKQALRCSRRGHLVGFSPPVAEKLGLPPSGEASQARAG